MKKSSGAKAMAICPQCDKLVSKKGLGTHMYMAHTLQAGQEREQPKEQVMEVQKLPEPVSALNQVQTQECPHCKQKQQQFDSLEATRHQLEAENKRLKAQEQQAVDAPSLREYIEHCEDGSCPAHEAEWNAIKNVIAQQAISAIPEEEIRKRAEALGLAPRRDIVIKNIEDLVGR